MTNNVMKIGDQYGQKIGLMVYQSYTSHATNPQFVDHFPSYKPHKFRSGIDQPRWMTMDDPVRRVSGVPEFFRGPQRLLDALQLVARLIARTLTPQAWSHTWKAERSDGFIVQIHFEPT